MYVTNSRVFNNENNKVARNLRTGGEKNYIYMYMYMVPGQVTCSRGVSVTFSCVRKRVVVRARGHGRFLSCLTFENKFRRMLVDASLFHLGVTVSFPRRKTVNKVKRTFVV